MKTLKKKISGFIQEFRKKSYFKQILYSYIIISCFTFLIFSILLLSIIQDQHYESMLEINEQNVSQAHAFNNSSLADISNHGYSMLENTIVHKLLYSSSYDISVSIASREIYDDILSISSMITSLDFINFSTGTVLTKTQRLILEQYYDQSLLDYIATLTPSRQPVFYQPREAYISASRQTPERVLSVIYYLNSNGALVINLDYDSYASQINLARSNDNMEMVLLNQNNLVMAATDSDLFMQDYSQNPLYLEVMEQPDNEGSFTWQDKNDKKDIYYHKGTKMGITYISILKQENTYLGSMLFGLTMKYSIIYIFVTLLLSFLFSWIIYRPVRRLRDAVRQKDLISAEETSPVNDFDFLESAFKSLVVKNSALSKAHQSYEEQQMQKMFRTLLEQNNPQVYITNEELEALDSSFDYLNYMVFIVYIDLTDSAQNVEMDIPLIKFIIANVATELLGTVMKVTSIETISNKCIYLVNFEQYDKLLIQNAAETMQAFFRHTGLFKVSFGFGSLITDLDSLSASYEDARIALSNGMLIASECIQFFEDLHLLPLPEQKYPYETDLAITNALKNTNYDALDLGLNTFFECIRSFHYDQMYRSINQLDAALRRFEYQSGLVTVTTDQDLNFLQPKNLTEIKDDLRSRCYADIGTLLEIKLHNQSKDDLIRQVQKIVEENIYNMNLSVVLIAEQVDLSVNYLRNLYKENTGESLSTYITNRKLAIICDLLADTDTQIQEISDKLGFSTKNYFFTFFKKHMNMTPNQYRNKFN